MNKNKLKNICMMLVAAGLLSACGSSSTSGGSSSTGSSSSGSTSSTSGGGSTSGGSTSGSSTSGGSSSGSAGPGLAVHKDGYVELPNGRGGVNIEATVYDSVMGFDKKVSQAAFEKSVYPILRANCAGCHSTENTAGSGAQAPLHSDVDPELAHEYALTRVSFREIHDSKLSTRLWIDRHNCFDSSCSAAAKKMDDAIGEWYDGVKHMLPEVPRLVDDSTKISDSEIQEWIDADKAKLSGGDQEFIQYTSLHVLHNEGVSAQNLNHARVGLSKALNSTARWAPEIVNPVDVNGKGILYKFDIRDYWGWSMIDTSGNFQLWYGGSDDDLAFASKKDLNGNDVSFADLGRMKHTMKSSVSEDLTFARAVWARVLKGNAEGADGAASLPPNIDGLVGKRTQGGNNQPYIKPEDFKYAEVTQLIYTLTRPDVYNAIMAIPGYSTFFEEELGVQKNDGADSFDWILTHKAITIDARQYFRAKQTTGKGGYYWKTFDTFATGWENIDEIYAKGEGRSPFWASPIPKFISAGGGGGTSPSTLSIIQGKSLFASDANGERGGGVFDENERDGGQQMAEEVIWSLPNGLQGYALFGGFNQRRVDAFTHIVRDPRILRGADDDVLVNYAGDGHRLSPQRQTGISDVRLNNASSCIGCHIDGMNRGNNDIRDWLDESPGRLPKGKDVTDRWRDDASKVARIKELYQPSEYTRKLMEDDRRPFLEAMGEIKSSMMLGDDINTYVEPCIWNIEWARNYYAFPVTRSS